VATGAHKLKSRVIKAKDFIIIIIIMVVVGGGYKKEIVLGAHENG
jgi:hypothetical protein